jgi:hypothetical protein
MAIGAPSRQKGTKMSVLDELVKKENWTVDRTLITGVPLLTYLEDISFGEIEEAADELASLRDELQDYKDDAEQSKSVFKRILDEKCPSDEVHCTCVPHLREEYKKLEAERDDYKSKWEYVEGLNKAVVAQNDSIKAERDALKLVADAARTGQGLDDALDALKGEK